MSCSRSGVGPEKIHASMCARAFFPAQRRRPNADPAHSQSASHTLPQGVDEAVLVAQGAMWGSRAFPRRLVVQLQNSWYHGLACWCDLPEEFQEVDIVNKTMQQLAFA